MKTTMDEYVSARTELITADVKGAHFVQHSEISGWCLEEATSLLHLSGAGLQLGVEPRVMTARLSHIFKTALPISIAFENDIYYGEAVEQYGYKEKLVDCQDQFEAKNNDYGDGFRRHGPVGVLIRIHDKLSRMHSLIEGIQRVSDEAMHDTAMDLINYFC